MTTTTVTKITEGWLGDWEVVIDNAWPVRVRTVDIYEYSCTACPNPQCRHEAAVRAYVAKAMDAFAEKMKKK
jgi:hypothetical protein